MTKQTLLRHIRSFSVKARDIRLSIQEARNVAVANGLMTNKTPKGKLTRKGQNVKFKNGKCNTRICINYHKLAIDHINKLFE